MMGISIKSFIGSCKVPAFCLNRQGPSIITLNKYPSNDRNLAGTVTGGSPYLVPRQTIDIAITKFNPIEDQDPDNPSVLVNGELIASTSADGYTVVSAEHPILWYIATVNGNNTDTFFRHGIFVLGSVTFP
jgi:hypothetical protein